MREREHSGEKKSYEISSQREKEREEIFLVDRFDWTGFFPQ